MKPLTSRRPLRLESQNSRRGAILVTVALTLTFLLGCVALAVDVGFLVLADGELQMVADSSALAAAREFNGRRTDQDVVDEYAIAAAVDAAEKNSAGGHASVEIDEFVSVRGETHQDIRLGHRLFDRETGEYRLVWEDLPGKPHNVVEITARLDDFQRADSDGNAFDTVTQAVPLIFMNALGQQYASVEATATATYQPRDMVLVLDESGSMRFDSLLYRDTINRLGTTAVVNTIEEMWSDLGYPSYGNMDFEAEYPTFEGVGSGRRPVYGYYYRFGRRQRYIRGYETVDVPDISIVWKGYEVDISSDERISQVVLFFSNGRYRFYDVSSNGCTLSSNVRITGALVKSGNNGFLDPYQQDLGEYIDLNSNSAFKRALGVDSVGYPYAHERDTEGRYVGDPWTQYINYVRYDRVMRDSGFRNRFGMLTLVHFWNHVKASPSETPDLANTRQQPMGALKDAVNSLLNYIVDVEADDRVGLVTFSTEANLDVELDDFDLAPVRDQAARMQAYGRTNIGDALRLARIELTENARPQAARTIVLMTDGNPNEPGNYDPADYVRSEAQLAADEGIRVITISLGSRFDHTLMEEVAELTNGVHHEVPDATASDPEAVERELERVFSEEIAADRSLTLIK
jgi:Mg-chelatase subunit ChlD